MTAVLAFFLSHCNTGSASRPVLPSRWSYLLDFPQLPCYAESIVFVPVGGRGCLYCFWGGHVCVWFFCFGRLEGLAEQWGWGRRPQCLVRIEPFVSSFLWGRIRPSVFQHHAVALLFHLPRPSQRLEEGKHMRNRAWLLHGTHCTCVGGSAASELLKTARESSALRDWLIEQTGQDKWWENQNQLFYDFMWNSALCPKKNVKNDVVRVGELQASDNIGRRISNFKKKLANLIATANGHININKALNTSQISFIFKSKVQDTEVVICVSPADTKLIEIKTRNSRQTLWVKR